MNFLIEVNHGRTDGMGMGVACLNVATGRPFANAARSISGH